MTDDQSEFDPITIDDGNIFAMKNTPERVFRKRDILLPKLEILFDEAVELLTDVFKIDPFASSTINRRPAFRPDTLRPEDYGDVYVGLGPKRDSRQKKLKKPDGTPAAYGYFALRFVLQSSELFTALHLSRPPEVEMLFQIMRRHPERCASYMEERGLSFFDRNEPNSDLSRLAVIERGFVPTDAQWHVFVIFGEVYGYPIASEGQWVCIWDYVLIMPFYLAMVDEFFGREDHLLEYLDKVESHERQCPPDDDSDRSASDDDEIDEEEDAGEATRHFKVYIPDEDDKETGRLGELFALEHERARLISINRPDLADKIVHVSVVEGDGAGYDIRSFDENEQEIYIEVKTTTGGRSNSFIVTPNEVRCSDHYRSNFRLYRVYDFPDDPKLFVIEGSLTAACKLDPTGYRASLRESNNSSS